MSDMQTFINLFGGGALFCLGWFAKELWDAVKDLKLDLAKLREELPKEYAMKSDMQIMFDKIDSKLDRLMDKLEAKADK
jgi:hypothetical protein